MTPVTFMSVSLAVCVLIAAAGRAGLRKASDGAETISWARVLAPAIVGGMIIAGLIFWKIPSGDAPIIDLCLVGLGAALGAAAIIDRDTGWAPDVLMAVLSAKAMVLGTIVAGWGIGPLTASLVGIGILVAINLLWLAASVLTGSRRILPPADILAFALPFMIFGASPYFVAIMLSISVLGLLGRRVPAIHAFFTNPKVGDKVLREMDLDDSMEAKGVTLLAIALPAVWVAMVFWFI